MTQYLLRFSFPLNIFLLLTVILGPVKAQETGRVDPLPEPLTLDYALSLANEAYPDVDIAQADLAIAEAVRMQAESLTGFNASLIGRASWIQPPEIAPDQSHGDHSISFFIYKRLYDFGRSGATQNAADAEVKHTEWSLMEARNQRRIQIMQHYFDVLLADLKYARDNEAMAVAYISYDRARDRNKLGQVSDIGVLEEQSNYQEVRRQRYQSEAKQRIVRARLANILNRPGKLPATLVPPELPENKRQLPEVDELISQGLEHNPVLLALKEQVNAAEERVRAARTYYRPVIDGEAQVSAYSREMANHNVWSATIIVDVPLYTSGAVRSKVLKQEAELQKQKSLLSKKEMEVQQAILETWLELDTLKAKQQEVRVLRDYRDLYLDRSRALYEMEVKADLGDAMVQTSEAKLRVVATEFQISLAWARLDALLGAPLREGKGLTQ